MPKLRREIITYFWTSFILWQKNQTDGLRVIHHWQSALATKLMLWLNINLKNSKKEDKPKKNGMKGTN